MKKSLKLLGAAALLCASTVFAEGGFFEGALPENWTADVVAGFKMNFLNYSNWANDGTSSYTWIFNYDADVQGKWKIANWRNLIDLELGKTWTDGLGTRKSADKIFWESMVDFNTSETLKPYVGLRYETQFLAGYDYSVDEDGVPVSSFMDPVYFTQVAGLAYIPNEHFSQRLGFANRVTVSHGYGFADDKDTDDEIEEVKDEPGLESITEIKYSFSEIFSFKSRLWAFVNFKCVDEIDAKWENLLTFGIAPLIELQAGYDVVYDKDLDESTQHKVMLLFGITWRLF